MSVDRLCALCPDRSHSVVSCQQRPSTTSPLHLRLNCLSEIGHVTEDADDVRKTLNHYFQLFLPSTLSAFFFPSAHIQITSSRIQLHSPALASACQSIPISLGSLHGFTMGLDTIINKHLDYRYDNVGLSTSWPICSLAVYLTDTSTRSRHGHAALTGMAL